MSDDETTPYEEIGFVARAHARVVAPPPAPVPVVVVATVRCSVCGEDVNPAYLRPRDGCVLCVGQRNRERADRMQDAIRALKDNPPRTSDAERDAIKQLHALGHPDANTCVRAICKPAPTRGR